MLSYYGHKVDVVEFVDDLVLETGHFLSITITGLARSEDCCVFIATDTSSVDIVEKLALSYSLKHIIIWCEIILDGLFQEEERTEDD